MYTDEPTSHPTSTDSSFASADTSVRANRGRVAASPRRYAPAFRVGATAAMCVSLIFGAVSCASDDDSVNSAVSMKSGNSASATASGNQSAESKAAKVPMDSDSAPAGDFTETSAEARQQEQSYLGIEDVRVGSHGGFDRIVFEFSGEGSPGYFIRYEDMPTQQASGRPIRVNGASKLAVDLRGTGYPFDFNMEDFPTGPVQPTDSAEIADVVGAGTFEGTSQYVVGLKNDRRPFKVFTLQNPTRLVIDIKTDK